MTTDVLSVICAVIVVGGVFAFVVDRWWLVWDWWPLVGPDWRAERRDYPCTCDDPWFVGERHRHYTPEEADRRQLEATRQEIAAVIDLPGPQYDPGGNVPHEWRNMQVGELDEDDPDDESWADELHAINQELHGNIITGQFGDLTRPVAKLTHYEVEAVIVQLGHADWLPAAA